MKTRICESFGLEFPIFAFSHCRDVVAAVSRAGGFGVLGALAFSREELERELDWIDRHAGGKPYGVDVVMPATSAQPAPFGGDAKQQLSNRIPPGHRAFVAELLARYDVPPLPPGADPETLLGWSDDGGRSHVDVALNHPIKLLVNALGPPPADVVARAHALGVKVAALVGTVAQAKKQIAAGVDLIIAQGSEAGGHTGDVATMVLTPDVVDAVHPTPVLAAGGIGSGRQMAAAMALGADGVWTGSIWLTVKESDTSPALVEKLLNAQSTDTVRSRALSGKPARQLRTPWTDAWDGDGSPGALPMPLQYMLIAEAQARIGRYGQDETSGAHRLLGSAVGQVVGRMKRVRTARDVIYDMVSEYLDVVAELNARSGAHDALALPPPSAASDSE